MHVWNAGTGKPIVTYLGSFSTGEVLAIAWSADGTYLASSSNAGIVQVWNAATGVLLLAFSNMSGEDEVSALA